LMEVGNSRFEGHPTETSGPIQRQYVVDSLSTSDQHDLVFAPSELLLALYSCGTRNFWMYFCYWFPVGWPTLKSLERRWRTLCGFQRCVLRFECFRLDLLGSFVRTWVLNWSCSFSFPIFKSRTLEFLTSK